MSDSRAVREKANRTKGADERSDADNPGVIAPPPLIYAGALAAGLLANRRYRIPFLPRRVARTLALLWSWAGSR